MPKKLVKKNTKTNNKQKPSSWLEHLQASSEEYRRFLLKIIVGVAAILVIGFWLWTFFNTLPNLANSNTNQSSTWQQGWQELTNSLKKTTDQVKAGLGNLINIPTQQQNLVDATQNLATTLNLDTWLVASSTNLNITVKYPASWQSRQLPNALLIDSFAETTTTLPEIRTQLEITTQPNPKKLTNLQWYQQLQLSSIKPDYTTTTTDLTIDNLAALKRIIANPNANPKDSVAIINLAKGSLMYEITVSTFGDQQIYQVILDEIINSIKFAR
jgi:hypothetical protein